MKKYKPITHAVAAALGTLVLAGLSAQGRSLIAKLPHGETIYAGVAFVGVVLGVYHMPLAPRPAFVQNATASQGPESFSAGNMRE